MGCGFLGGELRGVDDSGGFDSRGVGVGDGSRRFEGLEQLVVKEAINVTINKWSRVLRDLSRGSVVSGNSEVSTSSRNLIFMVVSTEGNRASVMFEVDNVKFVIDKVFPGG